MINSFGVAYLWLSNRKEKQWEKDHILSFQSGTTHLPTPKHACKSLTPWINLFDAFFEFF